MPDENSDYNCLAVLNVDSAFKKDGNYYLQGFLKECKYIEKEVTRYITGDIISSESDEE